MAHDREMLPIFVAAVSIFLVAHVICHVYSEDHPLEHDI